MDVSIIIVNYNSYQLILKAIESIYAFTEGLTFEIIVVDNNSPQRDIEQLQDHYKEVHYISNVQNKGFGSGNNVGAKYAKGKYLFLLNPDTLLLNNAIGRFFSFCEKKPQVGIVGGNLYDLNRKPAFSCWSFLPGLLAEIDFLCHHQLGKLLGRVGSFNYTDHPQKVGYISGADLFIARNTYLQAGGFDEDFFMYYEETELTYRVKQLGYEVYILPDASIIHLEGQSESDYEKIGFRMRQSEKLYYRKTKQQYLIPLSYIVDIAYYQLHIFYNKIKGDRNKMKLFKDKLCLIRKVEKI